MVAVAFALSKLATMMQSDICVVLSYFQGRAQAFSRLQLGLCQVG